MYVCILSYLQVVCMYVCISLAAGHRGEGVPLPPPPQRFFKHSVKIENRHWQGKNSSIFKYFFNFPPPPPTSPQSETLRAIISIIVFNLCMYVCILSYLQVLCTYQLNSPLPIPRTRCVIARSLKWCISTHPWVTCTYISCQIDSPLMQIFHVNTLKCW